MDPANKGLDLSVGAVLEYELLSARWMWCALGARWPTPPHVQRGATQGIDSPAMSGQFDGASTEIICLHNGEGPRPPSRPQVKRRRPLVVAAHKWSLLPSWPTELWVGRGGTTPNDQCDSTAAWTIDTTPWEAQSPCGAFFFRF